MQTSNTNLSETPRTNAVVGQREYGSLTDSEYVRLARQLERELNEANAKIDKLTTKHKLALEYLKSLNTVIQ